MDLAGRYAILVQALAGHLQCSLQLKRTAVAIWTKEQQE